MEPLRVEYDQSPTIGAIAKALAAAQKTMGNAAKDSTNPHFKSKYADLASVRDATAPLADNGIAVTQQVITGQDGVPGIRTVLMHESGEWMGSNAYCRPAQNTPQGLGSVVTYLRRYMLAAAAGIAQEDDDGNVGSQQPTRNPPRPAARPHTEQESREKTELETKLQASVEAAKEAKSNGSPKADVAAKNAGQGNGVSRAGETTPDLDPSRVTKIQTLFGKLGLGVAEADARQLTGTERKEFLRDARLEKIGELINRKIATAKALTIPEFDKCVKWADEEIAKIEAHPMAHAAREKFKVMNGGADAGGDGGARD